MDLTFLDKICGKEQVAMKPKQQAYLGELSWGMGVVERIEVKSASRIISRDGSTIHSLVPVPALGVAHDASFPFSYQPSVKSFYPHFQTLTMSNDSSSATTIVT